MLRRNHSLLATRYSLLKSNRGQILIQALFLSVVAVVFITAMASLGISTLETANRSYYGEQAFQIAEAGIEYYRWHLAHSPEDFQDGTNAPGPYYHDYRNKDGEIIGQFSLDILPPPVGSTVVTILSTGTTTADLSAIRKIRAQLAVPSLAKYATVANDFMRFGEGTEIFGSIHSNQGIRFDGVANNIVSSALSNFNDPDHSGNNEFAVHTHRNEPPATGVNNAFRPLEAPPTSPVPNRPDVFRAGRSFPVPAVDFTGFTADLSQMKADAQANGKYFGSSGSQGYLVVLKTNDTFDLYRVNTLVSPPSGCTNTLSQSGWGTWSIGTAGSAKTFLANHLFPANGVIFLEDHVWVEGSIQTAHITIASGKFPENVTTNTSITVNNDLIYTNYDGQDVVALVAQNNVNAGLKSDTDLRIDAALIAKSGRVGRYYYRPPGGGSNCSPDHVKTSITLYGMIGTNQRYGFAYTDGTGYATRTITYDANLLYSPPPSFPLTSDQYETILWEEVR